MKKILDGKTLMIIIESIIIVGLVLAFFLVRPQLAKPKENIKIEQKNIIPAQEAGNKAIEFINKNFLSEDNQASLLNVEEESGVYKMKISIQGREYTSYVTKDGKYLFPEGIDLIPPKPIEFPKTQRPDVKLFVMSFCPFGNQAEEMLIPVAQLLKDKANIELHYIFYSNYGSGYPNFCYDKENKYCSMHGIQELHQDIRELCVAKYQKDKLWDFVKEINAKANSQNVDQKWEEIARGVGIDVEKIKECFKNEAQTFLEEEMALTNQKYPVQNPSRHNGTKEESILGSPTLLINGVIYDGARSAQDFKNAICSAFQNPPEECNVDLSDNTSQKSSGSCQ